MRHIKTKTKTKGRRLRPSQGVIMHYTIFYDELFNMYLDESEALIPNLESYIARLILRQPEILPITIEVITIER
jgi:hypothetical protein